MQSHHDSGPDCGFPHGDARLDSRICIPLPKPGEAGDSQERSAREVLHARALSIIASQTPLDLRTSSTASRIAP
jgi:hypothetical protein